MGWGWGWEKAVPRKHPLEMQQNRKNLTILSGTSGPTSVGSASGM